VTVLARTYDVSASGGPTVAECMAVVWLVALLVVVALLVARVYLGRKRPARPPESQPRGFEVRPLKTGPLAAGNELPSGNAAERTQ
jgi:hypothetical protein